MSWVNKKLAPGVQNITTVDEAEKILTGEDKAILAVLDSLSVPSLLFYSSQPRCSF